MTFAQNMLLVVADDVGCSELGACGFAAHFNPAKQCLFSCRGSDVA